MLEAVQTWMLHSKQESPLHLDSLAVEVGQSIMLDAVLQVIGLQQTLQLRVHLFGGSQLCLQAGHLALPALFLFCPLLLQLLS